MNGKSTTLSHHGIKGQKWGVRNGPPYPIEDKTLRKGTRLNSVSINPNSENYRKRGRWMYTYNPNDKWDRSVYKGPFSMYVGQTTGYLTFEHQYEVTKDLKMPTKKERYDEYVELYKKNVNTFTKDLQYIQNLTKNVNMGPAMDKAKSMDLKNVKTEEDFKEAYKLFNHAMENVEGFKSTQLYAKAMSKKYDAMVDDNNQGIYNDAHDPVIIFNPDKTLKSVGKAIPLSMQEIMLNYFNVQGELAKRGEKVKL